ncbi:MAG: S8 family serine peptidase [Chloroflexota bacterium]
MNRDRLLQIALSTVILISIVTWPASAQPPVPPSPTLVPPGPPQAGGFAPGEVLLKFKPGTTAFARGLAAAQVAAQEVDHIPQINVRRWKVTPGKELETIAALKKNPTVQYAELNYIAYAIGTPSDTYFSYQWGMAKINAPQAWDITTGISTTKIAILDTGIDADHEDLASKTVLRRNLTTSGTDDDLYGHGTHVAGIAAAATNNGIGVAGVGYNAVLMSYKVLGDDGVGSYSWLANGITWAADDGAKVINMSLAGLYPSQALQDAVNYAHGKGSLIVAAAGNCAQSCWDPVSQRYLTNPDMYPAAYANVVAVAATNQSDQWATFSEYRPYVDLAAPGVSIFSTLPNHSNWISTNYGYPLNYYYLQGTSMATPHVSGLAALIWTVAPDVTNDQVESIMESTAVDLGVVGRDDYFGWGRIDAYAAVKKASPTLSASPASLFYMADDTTDPGSKSVTVSNSAYNQVITWAATVPTSTAWLTVTPTTGIATTSSPATLSVQASRPGAYGTYTSPITITSTTQYVQDSPQVVNVTLFYTSTIPRVYLPIVFKNY